MTADSLQNIESLKAIGSICAETLRKMMGLVRAGMTTRELDEMGRAFLEAQGARSAPQVMYNFPGASMVVGTGQRSLDELLAATEAALTKTVHAAWAGNRSCPRESGGSFMNGTGGPCAPWIGRLPRSSSTRSSSRRMSRSFSLCNLEAPSRRFVLWMSTVQPKPSGRFP